MLRGSEFLVRNLARAALLVLALMPALVYLLVKYNTAQQMAADDARVQSSRAGYVIATNPESWRYSTERLADQIAEIRHNGTHTILTDMDGSTVLRIGEICKACITGRAPLMDFGTVIGELRVYVNIAPIFIRSSLVGGFGLLFGLLLMNLLNRHVLIPLERIKIANVELAFYDPLTGLPNRRLLMDRIGHALATSTRSGRVGAIMFVDLDYFKNVNDTLGHDFGDLMLQQVAHRLESCVRAGDTVARLGGDEFVVMLEGLGENITEAAALAKSIGDKIISVLGLPYQLSSHECRCTSSIGVTFFKGSQLPIDELLKQSDIAMYRAKEAGRNTMSIF